jgi:hypothetical protein
METVSFGAKTHFCSTPDFVVSAFWVVDFGRVTRRFFLVLSQAMN